MADIAGAMGTSQKKPLYYSLYFQVIVGIVLGISLGFFAPDLGAQMKPFGDGFIKLIKMMIGPIIFGTVAVGIAKMGDLKEVGRVGLKALIYFEVLTTAALVIGLIVANVYRPGAGINADPASFDTKAVQAYTTQAQHLGFVDYVMHIIPNTVISAFADGEILQVLLFSVLFGLALSRFGEKGRTLVKVSGRGHARAVRGHRHHHAAGADRRLRRDGVYDRQVRHRHLGLTRPSDAGRLCDVPAVRVRRPERDRLVLRLQPLEVSEVHQRRAADRARHVVVGIGAAALDDQDGEPGLRQAGRRALSSQPAIPSISTGPVSI